MVKTLAQESTETKVVVIIKTIQHRHDPRQPIVIEPVGKVLVLYNTEANEYIGNGKALLYTGETKPGKIDPVFAEKYKRATAGKALSPQPAAVTDSKIDELLETVNAQADALAEFQKKITELEATIAKLKK